LENNHQAKRRNSYTDDSVVPSGDHTKPNGYSESLYCTESLNGLGFLTMDSDTDDDRLFAINMCSLLRSDSDTKDIVFQPFSAEYTNGPFLLSMDSDSESGEAASPSQKALFDLECYDDDDDDEEGDDLIRSLQDEEEFNMPPVANYDPCNELRSKITAKFMNLSNPTNLTNLSQNLTDLCYDHTSSSPTDMSIFSDEVPSNVNTTCALSNALSEMKSSYTPLHDKICNGQIDDICSCGSPKSQVDGHVGKKGTECIASPVSVLPESHDMLTNHNVSVIV